MQIIQTPERANAKPPLPFLGANGILWHFVPSFCVTIQKK